MRSKSPVPAPPCAIVERNSATSASTASAVTAPRRAITRETLSISSSSSAAQISAVALAEHEEDDRRLLRSRKRVRSCSAAGLVICGLFLRLCLVSSLWSLILRGVSAALSDHARTIAVDSESCHLHDLAEAIDRALMQGSLNAGRIRRGGVELAACIMPS